MCVIYNLNNVSSTIIYNAKRSSFIDIGAVAPTCARKMFDDNVLTTENLTKKKKKKQRFDGLYPTDVVSGGGSIVGTGSPFVCKENSVLYIRYILTYYI